MATTTASSRTTDSSAPEFKEVLLAHAVSTKCIGPLVTDDAMGLPAEFDPLSEKRRDPKLPDWGSSSFSPSPLGHQEAGQTLGLHSLGVLPEFQGRGYGKAVLKSYIQRMQDANVAQRIAIITYNHLIEFYKEFGFIDKGRSEAKFGGGDWHDMVGHQHNRTNVISVFRFADETVPGS
ncbi:hypothetical protein FGG08_001587 [Glutinoglossum americanum]|uniref:N-acetyltransferase domain-containing protein n=1 Tax=Glutinoglossum americanum TaxID=1670608 RepID=A0A9P8I6P6_9PEZI|nr:hypothetical protein FGG08_001587 [Glutinoglossum americanum]